MNRLARDIVTTTLRGGLVGLAAFLLVYPILVMTGSGEAAFPGWGAAALLILVGGFVAIAFFFVPSVIALLLGTFLLRASMPIDSTQFRMLGTMLVALLSLAIAWLWLELQGIDVARAVGTSVVSAAAIGGGATGFLGLRRVAEGTNR